MQFNKPEHLNWGLTFTLPFFPALIHNSALALYVVIVGFWQVQKVYQFPFLFFPCQHAKGKHAKSGSVSQEVLDEKDERIQHLEEVNRTLKQTNDDQTEEMEELRQKVALLTSEVREGRRVGHWEGTGKASSGVRCLIFWCFLGVCACTCVCG